LVRLRVGIGDTNLVGIASQQDCAGESGRPTRIRIPSLPLSHPGRSLEIRSLAEFPAIVGCTRERGSVPNTNPCHLETQQTRTNRRTSFERVRFTDVVLRELSPRSDR